MAFAQWIVKIFDMVLYNILVSIFLVFNIHSQTQEIDSLIANKNYSLAEKIILSSIETNPNNEVLIKTLGDCYGYMKDWDNAIIQYRKLVEIDHNNAIYNYKLGGTLAAKANDTNRFKSLGLINEGKNYLIKSIELDNKNKEAIWALIQIFTELPQLLGGSKSIALQYANDLEKISLIDGLFSKKYIYEFKNDDEMASIYINKLTDNLDSFNQKYEYNYLNLSIGELCYNNMVKLDKAIVHLNLYINNYTSRDRTSPDYAYYLLSKIYFYKNDLYSAKKHLDNAIAYYNSNKIENNSLYKQMIKFKDNIEKWEFIL